MTSYRRRGTHAAERLSSSALDAPPQRAPRPAAQGRARQTGGTGGKRVSGFRQRPPLLRVVVAALVVAFGAAGFAGGLLSSPSAEPTVQAFLLDWQQLSYAAAAAQTTGRPAVVTAELRNAYRGLGAAAFYLSMGPIKQHGNTAQARFSVSVDLGQNGAPWNYQGQMSLREFGSGWKILWSPSVINPGLRAGLHLAMISTTPRRKPVLDAAGRPLQTPSTAFVVGVRLDRLHHPVATASALGRATGLQPTELLGWILAAPRASFQELAVLRPPEYRRLRPRLRKVPGLIIRKQKLRLFTSIAPAIVGSVGTEVSGALRNRGIAYRPGATVGLSGLQQAYQGRLAGAPTTKVITETRAGRQVSVLYTWSGSPPTAVRTTIDSRVQVAAASAVRRAPGSAAVVAVQASTGRILAVAEHAGKGMPRVSALDGQFQPGAAFTIVSTEALLAGGLQVTKPVRCTSVNDVGGRNFRNVPPVRGLGAQPSFAVDFAHACDTAFSGLSERLSPRELNAAATGFGLGAPWRLRLPGFSGSVQASGGFAQMASDTIGQGSVKVSPLAMALVAAEVDTGTRHGPSLVTVPKDPQSAKLAPFSVANLGSLRGLMRDTVRSGAARQADLPGQPVYGQVGTVELKPGKHPQWAHWFVGYRGGLAFAVLEITASPNTPAAQLGASFLASAPLP